jgi:hypothetical protein
MPTDLNEPTDACSHTLRPVDTSRSSPFDRFCRLSRRIRAAEEKSADFHDPLAGIDDRGMNIQLGYL